MNIERLKKYLWLLKTFQNGFALIQAYRRNQPIQEAILWNGRRLIHPEGQGGFVGTILELWFEECYTADLDYRPANGDVILDVGAHVGLFSIWCVRRNPNCRVESIEANRKNYACLAANLESIGAVQVNAHNVAIGKTFGRGRMEAHTDRSIDHQLIPAQEDDPESVSVVPLEGLFDIAQIQRIAFLKMDVEGAEHDVFAEVDQSLLRRIERIGLEYHDNLRPNTLQLLREKMNPTHELIVHPTENRGYGVLIGRLRA
jgi:FkbM family methyltransferase